jgi:hypothetical protein
MRLNSVHFAGTNTGAPLSFTVVHGLPGYLRYLLRPEEALDTYLIYNSGLFAAKGTLLQRKKLAYRV